MLILISGFSGSGKDAVQKRLPFEKIVSCTTRPKRTGEVDGKDYFYFSDDAFNSLKENNLFLKPMTYNANFGTVQYGTLRAVIENAIKSKEIYSLVSNFDEASEILSNYKDVSAYLLVAPDDVLEKRLKRRGDDEKEIHRRLKSDKENLKKITKFINSGNIATINSTTPLEIIVEYIAENHKV